jgi:thymidylate synthase (FAD)
MRGEPIDVTAFSELPQSDFLVLDHGRVKLIEAWGSDERIIEAARMSTGKGFQGWATRSPCTHCKRTAEELGPIGAWQHCEQHPEGGLHEYEEKLGDEKLLAYLWNNKHTTPFEMAGATFEISAPIFVFREWHRHRTQSYNEMSARYVPLPEIDYIPTHERCKPERSQNRQAAGSRTLPGVLTDKEIDVWLYDLAEAYRHVQEVYAAGIALGIPKELARLPVTVGRYSRMRASANLLNWTRFLTLRQAPNAMWEIQQYAHAICRSLSAHFPRTMALYKAGR